jgi:hypothetical protein
MRQSLKRLMEHRRNLLELRRLLEWYTFSVCGTPALDRAAQALRRSVTRHLGTNQNAIRATVLDGANQQEEETC